jgi:hypothetical protein
MLLRDLEGLGAYARAGGQALMPLTEDLASDALAAAGTIVEIMNDPDRLCRMQKAVAAYSQSVLAWPHIAERYDRIYRDAVAMARQTHEVGESYARTACPIANRPVASGACSYEERPATNSKNCLALTA